MRARIHLHRAWREGRPRGEVVGGGVWGDGVWGDAWGGGWGGELWLKEQVVEVNCG